MSACCGVLAALAGGAPASPTAVAAGTSVAAAASAAARRLSQVRTPVVPIADFPARGALRWTGLGLRPVVDLLAEPGVPRREGAARGTRDFAMDQRTMGRNRLSRAGYIMMRQPSQYASTLGRRLPCSPISRTSGALPPGARNQTSIPAPGTGVKPDMPAGSSVAACRTAGDPQQHTRG